MNKPLIILGNGGHASVLTEILLVQGEKIIGFTAPLAEENKFGLSYLGPDEAIYNYDKNEVELVLGIGMISPSSYREEVFFHFKKKGYSFKSIIHVSTIIAPSVLLGEGVQIMAGAIIQTGTIIDDNIIINTGSILDHNCHIKSHVHIAPGVKISGNVIVGTSTHIGTGTTVIQCINIGINCLIGAGSVVVKDIKDGKKAYGVPAKEV